jgi:hypothetical protein
MHRRLLSAAVALAFAGMPALAVHAAPAKAVKTAAFDTTTQLPRGVAPAHYDISLTPDAANASFSAKAVITVNIAKATDSITLNAADLAFSKASIAPAAGGAGSRVRWRRACTA